MRPTTLTVVEVPAALAVAVLTSAASEVQAQHSRDTQVVTKRETSLPNTALGAVEAQVAPGLMDQGQKVAMGATVLPAALQERLSPVRVVVAVPLAAVVVLVLLV